MANLSGFATADLPNVVVASRQNAEVRLTAEVATQAESVDVPGTPLLDSRKATRALT